MMRQKQQVYRDILSAQIQPNSAKSIGWRFIVQIDDDPKHTAKATQEFLKVQSGIFCNGWINLLISTRLSSISLAEDKTKDRKIHKQTTTEVSCSKDLAKHHKEETQTLLMSMSSDLRQSLPAKDSQQNIKNEQFIYDDENGGLCLKMVVIPKHFMLYFCVTLTWTWYFCSTSWINA